MYNPKIYIRDYGVPDHRILAFWRGHQFTAFDSQLKRDLILHADAPVGEEYVLLSGDAQSGADLLDLSGSGNDLLVLANDAVARWFGTDVELKYSIISAFPSWSYAVSGSSAGLRRAVIASAAPGAFVLTASGSGLTRSLLMAATASTFGLTANDAAISTNVELLSGDAQSGSDMSLLSGDAQSGTDFLLIS